ncbi:sugar ABC transporter ATP-binding protein [Pseudoxanthobacter sp.]|uniref:sugar ABC transporter ATP-binding protein n=1 Tax=Pseudoxanthobacter sp. TaxID=1925742 RepID=UPI002FE424B7
MLKLRAITKTYGATRALAGVDLDVGAGEVLALMGANGAGKSTLVKIISGVERADGGSLSLSGEAVSFDGPAAAEAAGIVAVHQSVADIGVPSLSVADNLLLDLYCTGRAPLVLSARAVRAEALQRAARVGLTVDPGARLDSLSLADRQLVAIARALATRPRVMIFDEPTASLSRTEAERLFALIEALRADGVAIIYISHKLSDLSRLATRVVVLRDGRVAAHFAPPIDHDAAVEAMIGRPVVRTSRGAAARTAQPFFQLRGARLPRGGEPFDLTAEKGEIVAVTGPLGAGKTTLAGGIFGIWPLEHGAISIGGVPFVPRDPARSIRAGVFYAGEDRWRTTFFPASLPFSTIAGAISFPFLPQWSAGGLLPVRREARAGAAGIRDFGIKAQGAAQSVSALSGGNQQKVVLARWHAEPARVLLLDEPFQGVDVGAREDIIAALRARSADRATLVFVSDFEEALEVGDRIVTLDAHRLVSDGHAPAAALSGTIRQEARVGS